MFRYYMKLGAKRVELVQLMHKFVPQSCIRIFRKERTGSTPLEPYSCSGAFRSVSVHLAMFRYCTKLGAKRVKLVQLMKKFVPRNRIRVFHNERTRSSPLDVKLMNWCVLLCLVAFWIVSLLHETRCEIGWTGAINAKVRATNSHRHFWQRTHAIQSIGP